MAANNARQADVPVGATIIENKGTAPGLICPIGPVRADGRSEKVIYAVPGVPWEMRDLLERAVLPDLQARAGTRASIVSRVLRTWGESESGLAERIAHRLEALEGSPTTLAFLASGIEGIKVRITAKAGDELEARRLVEAEEAELRAILGDIVFGVDDETMEHAVGALIHGTGRTIGLAESVTGGLAASRICDEPGSSEWFKGSIVSYASEVKWDVLGLPHGCRVVTAEAAGMMAEGARRVLGADIGLAVTGVAGPAEQEGMPVGTVFVGIALSDTDVSTHELHLPGDRDRIRQFATIGMFDLLRRRLLEA
jgi:nicotinamide-nucleotide amidase